MFDTYEGAYSEEADTDSSFHPPARTPRIVGVEGLTAENEKHTPSQQGSSVVS